MTTEARNRLAALAIAGECLLVVLALAWAVFERPAPVVTVSWREGLSDDARRQDEIALHLVNGQKADDVWQYELRSLRTRDIEAVIAHPDVDDTQHIDRGRATIGDDAGRGTERVWWAGPATGAGSRRLFRVVFAVAGALTLGCALLARSK